MRLFRRTTADEAAIPEDLRPYYSGQTNGFRRWLGPIFRILLLLILLALLVWAGVSLVNYFAKRNDDTKDKNNTPATSQQAQKEKDDAAKKKAANDKAAKDAAAKKAADEKAAKEAAAKKDAAAKKAAEDKAAAEKKAAEQKLQTAQGQAPAPTPASAGTGNAGTETGSGAVAANPPAPSAGTQSLVNTGPAEVGEIIALFVGTTIVAGAAHRLYVEMAGRK